MSDHALYGGIPPHVGGSDTSLLASLSVRGRAPAMRERVLAIVRDRGQAGATCDEIEAITAFRHQTASARVRELELLGRIEKTDAKRKTRSGRYARVYVVLQIAPTVHKE